MRFTLAPGTTAGVSAQPLAPRRFFGPPRGRVGDVSRLADYAGGVVVTSEHPSAVFARVSTPPEWVALLERHARLLLDLPIERAPDPSRVYEPFELTYIPFTGLATLERPGPRLRVWVVLPAACSDDVAAGMKRSAPIMTP